MPNTLIDAGPLIALFDKDDKYHQQMVGFLKRCGDSLVTTWPVITETCHMLDFSVNAQLDFLEWIYRGGAQVHALEATDLRRIIALTRKCEDRPMDLADASLVVASETLGVRQIISIDSDFHIYRREDGHVIQNVFLQPR